MAKLTVNGLFVDKLAGKHGEAVVRSRFGRMFTSRLGTRSARPPTEGQREVHNRFKLANGYASGVLRDPVRRPPYELIAKSRRTSTFGQAMSDYLRSPEITMFDVTKYRGKIGDKIHVLATDDTGVISVQIVIRSATNAVLEQGAAVFADNVWTYTGTTALPVGQQVSLDAAAKDRPGNITLMVRPFTATA